MMLWLKARDFQTVARMALLALLMTLASPLMAQEAATPGDVPETAAEKEGEPDEPADSATEDAGGTPDRSPFDYRASEQISEDRSVSFPVDI